MIRPNELLITNLKEVFNERCNLMRCVRCAVGVSILRDLRHVRCRNKFCRYTFPITTNTLFYNNKLSNEEILVIMNYLLQGGRTDFIHSVSGISKPTIRRLRLIITDIFKKMFNKYICKIGGSDIVVKIEESKF